MELAATQLLGWVQFRLRPAHDPMQSVSCSHDRHPSFEIQDDKNWEGLVALSEGSPSRLCGTGGSQESVTLLPNAIG